MSLMDQVAVNLGAPPTQLARLREKQRELADLEKRVTEAQQDAASRVVASQLAEDRLNASLDDPYAEDGDVSRALHDFRLAKSNRDAPAAVETRLEVPIGRLRQEILTLKQQIKSGQ